MTAHEGHGWGVPWLLAAHAWLARSGCSVDGHDAHTIAHFRESERAIEKQAASEGGNDVRS